MARNRRMSFRTLFSPSQRSERTKRWRKRFPRFSFSPWQSTRIVENVCGWFRATAAASRAVRMATGSQVIGVGYGRSLRLEGLEDRRLLAADVWVNDNWALIADNGALGVVDVGDVVRNDNDTLAPGTITQTYGVDAYGVVTTGLATGSLAAFDSIQDAVTGVDPGGDVNILDGTFSEAITITNKNVNLIGSGNGATETVIDSGALSTPLAASAGSIVNASNLRLQGGIFGIDVNMATVTVTNAVLLGGSAIGVQVTNGGAFGLTDSALQGPSSLGTGINVASGTATISGSVLSNRTTGLVVASGSTASITNSDLSAFAGGPSNYAIQAVGATNASGNWWGVNTVAGVQGKVQGPVDISPFLDTFTDANAGVGFDGDRSHLHVTAANPQTAGGRIQEAITLLADGTAHSGAARIIDVHAGTYAETANISKSAIVREVALETATVAPMTGAQQSVLTVSAQNVTIDGLSIQVNQGDDGGIGGTAPIAPVGIVGTQALGNFNGLTIKNTTITSIGDNALVNWTGSPSLSVRGAGIVLFDNAGNFPSVTIENNNVNITSGSSFFQRGLWLGGLNADITGNTLRGVSNDLIFQFASGGASLIDNNDFLGVHHNGGGGVVLADLNGSSPITVSNNTFTPTSVPGINTTSLQVNYNGSATSPISIQGNTFTNQNVAIEVGRATGVTISGNQITPEAGFTGFVHVLVDSQNASNSNIASPLLDTKIDGNTFNSALGSTGVGVVLQNDSPFGATYALGGVKIGVTADNIYDGALQTGVRSEGGAATISDTINNLDTAIAITGGTTTVAGSSLSGNTTGISVTGLGTLDVGAGNTITGGATGLIFSGPSVGLTGPRDLNDISFSGQSGDYITLASGAFDNQDLDGTDLTLGGINVDLMSPSQLAAAGAKITDELDDNTLGLVVLQTDTIFVTPATSPTPTDNDYTRIKNAVEAAGDNWTIILDGTFNWAETNAAASWALGNDGVTNTNDDYSITVPAGLDGVTLTASGALSSAKVSTGGDDPTVNLETFLQFWTPSVNTTNQDWTISNLEIEGFDLSLGFFFAANTAQFEGATITGNKITVPADWNATVAPGDVSQNIAIHYAFGQDQTIQNNQIFLDGSGLSDGANFSTSVGMQSNTSGGDVYDGLLIDNNTITVTGTLAVQPSVILGIWENGHAHLSDVTVSNNDFVNDTDNVTPNAAANLMRAFRVTSHSSATTTVTYSGNTVDGANIGFQWIAGSNFAAEQPVVVSNNTITNSATGFLVQSNGKATFAGNSVTGASGIGLDVTAGSNVTLTSGTFQNLDVAIRMAGAGSISGVNFNSGTDNDIDLQVLAGTGVVTLGAGNQFGGSDYFIDNASTNNFDLAALGYGAANYEGLDPLTLADAFAIENRLRHKVDAGNAAAGLIRVNAGMLYVTTPGAEVGISDETIQGAVNAAAANDTVNVQAGTYLEDVQITVDGVKLLGAGPGLSMVSGPIGGAGATVQILANNVELAGFTITREGNNTTDWNNAGLNSAGVAIQGLALSGALIRDNLITRNRTAIDVNNSGSHTIRNNRIYQNRTGLIFRNQTDNVLVTENEITDNSTVGVLFLDAGGAPPQQALGSVFFNNNISGNWYGQVVDRQGNPTPGTTNLKDFSGNYFGSTAPVVTTANSTEPGYAAQLPAAWVVGGSDVAPGGQPDIAGPASANIDFTAYLNLGTDTDLVEYGFQGDFSDLTVTTQGALTGAVGRIQEGINLASATATIHVLGGAYSGNVSTAGKAITLAAGASPAQVTINGDLALDANDVLPIELTGTNALTLYDNFIVNGAVALGGATLTVTRSFDPFPGNSFTIIGNDLADAVGGTFAGLPEGSTIVVGGVPLTVSYVAGPGGNDVVLTVTPQAQVWVNDTWIVTNDIGAPGLSVGDTVDSDPGSNDAVVTGKTFGYDAFSTIQSGVNAVATAGTVNVLTGTYAENVTVNKAVNLVGANAGIAGDGGRGFESNVVTNGAANLAVFTVTAAGVTIDGFTIDGDDVNFAGVDLTSGDNANASYGVRALGAVSNLTLANNIIEHVQIGFRGDGASSGNVITKNLFDSIGHYDFGYGVSLRTNFYADVIDNKMTRVHSGIHTNNFSGATGPASWSLSSNDIEAYGAGIWHNLQYNGATSALIDDNDITTIVAPTNDANALVRANYDNQTIGILVASIQDNVGVTLTNNSVTGVDYGLTLFNTTTANTITVGPTNTISGNDVGVYLTNIVGFNPVTATILGGAANNPTGVSKAILNGAVLTNNGTGILLRGDNPSSAFGAELALTNAVAISGGATGLSATGPLVALTGGTLADTAFSGQTNYYASLSNGALDNLEINATATTFNGLTGAAATLPQRFAIEDKLRHAPDDAGVGLVRAKAGEVFVTTPGTGLSDETIQRAVDVASVNDMVHVQSGTFSEDVQIATQGVKVIGAGSGLTTIDYTGQPGNGNGGVHIIANGAELRGVTVTQTVIDATPRYGVKVDFANGVTIDGVEISNSFRTGLDLHGVTNVVVNNVNSHDNGGAGIFMTDVKGAALSNITTNNNPWAGVSVATSGQFVPIGTNGIVFSGVNSFGESNGKNGGLQLEMFNFATNMPFPITWSNNLADGADVTIQAADFEYALSGHSFDGGANTTRYVRFYDTLLQAQNAAALVGPAGPDHIDAGGTRYIQDADNSDGAFLGTTDFYVFDNANDTMSIQAAVDAARSGDTINVFAGTYVENVSINKNLNVRSDAGRAATTIQGISGVGSLGAVVISGTTTDVNIGDLAGNGFTIIGIDNGLPGIENGAIYLLGAHSGTDIRWSDVVANGDHGLVAEFGATLSSLTIDNNIFSGQTFIGPNPAGATFAEQFTLPNVPRQLVVIGNAPTKTNITFTNNLLSGVAGGISTTDDFGAPVAPHEQGNVLATIDATGATFTGNTFSGSTTGTAFSLRARGTNNQITNNQFTSVGMGANTTDLFVNNTGNVIQSNTFTSSAGTAIQVAGGSSRVGATGLGNSATGYTNGLRITAGNVLVEGNTLNGNTIGVRIDGGVVDLGQNGAPTPTNYTGLGISAGGNNFNGYAATATASSGAIVNLNGSGANANAGRQGTPTDVMAFGNTWAVSTSAGIENVVWHDADNPAVGFVDFAAFAFVGAVTVSSNSINEGDAVTVSGTFDNVPQNHTVTISWGDSTPNTVIPLGPGVFNFNSLHTYDDDVDGPGLSSNHQITVTIQDTSLATISQAGPGLLVTVNDVAPTVTLSGPTSAGTGETKSYTFSTTDPGDDNRTPGELPLVSIVLTPAPGTTAFISNQLYDPITGNGSFDVTYTTVAGTGTVGIAVTVADDDGAQNTDSLMVNVENTLQVTSFTPTASGFIVTFNRAPDFAELNLYDSLLDGADQAPGALDPADVVLQGANTGPVRGSIVWRNAGNTLEFVKTGGILVNDNYTATLLSGGFGFNDANGNLDGDADFNDTESPDNYTNSFSVNNAAGTRVVSVRDFARGPGQDVDDAPATSNSRLAVSINDATDVISVELVFRYDPSLLTTDALASAIAAGLPPGYLATFTGGGLSGQLSATLFGFTPMTGTDKPLLLIEADVLAGAGYGLSQVLRLTDVEVTTNSLGVVPSVGDSAVHKNVYLGDADGDGFYSGTDAGLINRTVPILNLDSGYNAHDWTDPVIVGDATGSGTIGANDAAFVAQKAVGFPRPEIPNLPGLMLNYDASGIDPTIRIPENILAVGGTVDVPVFLDIEPNITLLGATYTVSYDTNVLDFVSGVTGPDGADMTGPGWAVFAFEGTPGVVSIAMFSTGEPSGPSGVSLNLATLEFNVVATTSTTTVLDVTKSDPQNEGGLVWTTDDGSVVIAAAPPQVAAVFANGSSWNSSFRDYVDGGLGDPAARGYRMPGGAGQLTTLPWNNVNELKVVFSENVGGSLSIGDFSLVGTVFPDIDGKNANGMFGVLPTISSFAYDAMTFTVTLGLSAPLQSDVVNLVIASAGVTDASGNQLDGEWANGGDSFNSGNGVAGGNFSFRMLSLPGDVRDDFGMSGGRSVNAFDVQDVRDGQNGFVVTGVGAFLYNERADVDGNGVVNATDAQYVRDAQLASIAAFPAAAPASTGLRTPSSPTFTPSVWTPADDAVSVDVTSSSLVADAGIDGVEWLAGWQQPTLGASEQDATGAAYDQVLETASVRPQYRPVAARTSQSPSETDLGYCDQAVDAAVDELFDFLEDEVEALFV